MSKHLTAEEARERLQYNPATGLFRWRRRHHGMQKKGWFAGSDTVKGYKKIRIMGKDCLSHRLAWLITHGEWPEHQIDHINRRKGDNRLGNLRDVTSKENNMNHIGKGYVKRGGRFQAKIGIDGATKYLGNFDTAEEAHAVYLKKKAELFPIGEVA
jgi:hypothetical protein